MLSLGESISAKGKLPDLIENIVRVYGIKKEKLALIPQGQMNSFLMTFRMPHKLYLSDKVDKYIATGGGWKIHLHVNPDKFAVVFEWLILNSNFGFKFQGSGDQEGKDFTIYIGSYVHMINLARILSEQLNSVLCGETKDLLWSDMEVEPKVFARFDVLGKNKSEFHQYGYKGIPWISEDFGQHYTMKNANYPTNFCMRRAHSRLFELYGDYYIGPKKELVSKIHKLLI